MRPKVLRGLKSLHAFAVEGNVCLTGTPDVCCSEGWLELKVMDAKGWPKRGGPLRIPHLTKQQRLFAIRHRRAGGAHWFLIKVLKEWLLIDGQHAMVVGNLNREELISRSCGYWDNGVDFKQLANILKEQNEQRRTFNIEASPLGIDAGTVR